MNAKSTAKRTAGVPAEIETVRRRFEQWRTQRRTPSPISDRLCDQAVRLAQQYGVSRVSRILRVGYYPLKDRVDRQAGPMACSSESLPAVTFVELGAPAPSPSLACLVEWEYTSGAKMRVQLQGMKATDLVVLSRSFICLRCGGGPVYQWIRPATFIRFVAQPPIQAKIFELQQLRCSQYGAIFTAPLPEGVPPEKNDPSVGILIGILRYGHGFPMNRQGKLQGERGHSFWRGHAVQAGRRTRRNGRPHLRRTSPSNGSS